VGHDHLLYDLTEAKDYDTRENWHNITRDYGSWTALKWILDDAPQRV
jgi:hypothetical protein